MALSLRTAMAKNTKGIMQLLKNGRNIGTSTVYKMKATCSPTLSSEGTLHRHRRKSLKEELFPKGKPLGEYVPVYVALGMITVSASLGLYTAKQELLHGPDVRVKKSRRETLPEVVEPEVVAHEAEDFINKSLFRKVAHIQEFETPIPNPIHGHPLSREPKVESLKTVGAN